MTQLDRRLFREMLREEWRLHTDLFGGRRFAAFPVMIAVIATGATWALTVSGTAIGAVIAGLHALVFAFGLHTGSMGLISRDAVRNLVGDATLLVFSGRTLPLSARRLVGIFLAKDAVYYSGLFLVPLSIGIVPIAGIGFLGRLPLLWASLSATFILGALMTFVGIGLTTRLPTAVVAVLLLGLIAVPWSIGVDPLSLTPYAFFRSPGALTALTSLLPLGAFAAIGLAAYDPTHRRPARTSDDRFSPIRDRLGDADGLLTKTLLDVSRSSGGFWKVVFSSGVLLAVTAGLIGIVEPLTGVKPSAPISFGALLGLSAFTTYNWLTQFDDLHEYSHHPVDAARVFRAKYRAFLLLGLPTVLGSYGVAIVLFGGAIVESIAGGILSVGTLLYLFGLTVYLTGFDPNEFLFDTLLYLAFTLGVSLGLVPVLILGFVLTPISPVLLGGIGVWGILLGGVGSELLRRSIPRWTRRYRR